MFDVAVLFLRLGCTAFGGPAAHVALIEEECVVRRRWLTREQFLDVLGAANLIPGPTSTELAMHVGLHRAGWAGLLVAGVAFILPAALMVGVLAALYVGFGSLPAIEGILRTVKPVVVIVVLQALVGLSKTALRVPRTAVVAGLAAVAVWLGVNEALVLVAAGLVSLAVTRGWPQASSAAWLVGVCGIGLVASGGSAGVISGVPLPALFAYFVRAGSAIFGSGYVLFAVLRHDLVEGTRWLTEGQLLDAIAVGQVTPGPVFTAATFIGYLIGGPSAAAVSTVGIFLPAFVFTALSAGVLHRLRNAPLARAFLDGVNGAAVALIALVTWSLARAAITDALTAGLALVAGVLIVGFRANSSYVLCGAALLGVFLG